MAGNRDEKLIDFEEELSSFQPSLDVSGVGDAIVKQDLTDMTDILMELMKQAKD
ncbi:MAG: hypothetical protein LIV11_05070 [Bacillota bacterium]|uniref:Uncharacterized protein n=1 Tax=[Clostridium] aminophilum TaxID=1526 RepID=A0A1I0B8F0_9FIRM|nr:hypothetical protein [[Clostridium] aminophilum]MCR4628209.1 hypothetical protein [Clostridium sp.]MDT3843932.1 hypothetical protein [Bacillota bacterium]SET02808.1 hypothetical protein SAMN04487771_1003116 [[Clostridium] aminophilum]SFR79684.1 hypothetical protein SAMN02910262_01657 [[Clostridium] aminophilum]